MRFWIHQVAVAFDQMINALLLGWADETFSARCYRKSTEGAFWYLSMRVVNLIFFWQDNHCFESYMSEQKRHQLPVEYRK